MATLLLADHDNKNLSDQTAKALTAASQMGSDVHVLVAGKGCKAVADQAAKLSGVTKVLLADAAEYEHMLAEPVAALIVKLAGAYDGIVAAATSSGKNVMPRVAALLDVMQVSDAIAVHGPDTFERPIYAGNAIQTVQATDAKKVMTVRTAGFQAAGEGGSAAVETVPAAGDPALSKFLEAALQKSDRPELTSARIIISGGRALGSREKFMEVVLPGCRQARRGRRRVARGGRCRLCAQRLAGRPDRQGRRTRPLHRMRHFGRHPAPCRHEGFQGDRGDQQGRGSTDLPGRGLRPRRGFVRCAAAIGKGIGLTCRFQHN